MIFAQADIGQMPAGLLKSMVILLIVTVVVASFFTGAVMQVLSYLREKKQSRKTSKVSVHPDPLRVQEYEEANVPEIEARHEEFNRRLFALDGPDGQVAQLWATLRDEDKRLEKRMNETFESIQRSLGRIEGKLDK